jgi:hypothetical protein
MLVKAINSGDVKLLTSLLKKPSELDYIDANFVINAELLTPLMLACVK